MYSVDTTGWFLPAWRDIFLCQFVCCCKNWHQTKQQLFIWILSNIWLSLGVGLFCQTNAVLYHTVTVLYIFLSADPNWGSSTLGVFLCLSCSGIHRNISEISKVKSLTLSRWEDHEIQVLLLAFLLAVEAGLNHVFPRNRSYQVVTQQIK